jgi:hypothetical protein
MKLFPEEDTAPLADVDTFWHYHILDTMKYATDCERVFGYFLHHYPYVGMDGTEEDEQFRLDSGDRMRDLYEATFGEAYPGSFVEAAEATAFCAGPSRDRLKARATEVAFCAGPSRDKLKAHAIDIAFCAGPSRDKLKAIGTNVSSEIAFCAGPSRDKLKARATGISSAVAFCAGPSRDRLQAEACHQ